ncbi:hypothetical protein EMIT0P294_30558 [Pseudomonas sp. IT-P294]
MSTFLINIAGATASESARFANISRHKITISENVSQKLELAYRREKLKSLPDEDAS